MNLFTKTLTAAAAALTIAVAFAPAAEARPGHGWGGGGHHGWHGGHRGPGWGYGRHWGRYGVVGVGLYGGGCYIARKRVYDDYSGRFIIVRRTVCG